MNWNSVSLVVLGLTAFFSAFAVALWISLVIWTFRDMRARTRDAFAQLLASLMVLVLGPFGVPLYLILRPRETLAEKYERSLEEEALLQDIEERQICPGCKQPIETDFVICPVCHTRLRRPCIHCGRLIHPRWSMCPYCAQSQKPIPGEEKAGRVTLLDLEAESQVPEEQVPAGWGKEFALDESAFQPGPDVDEHEPETLSVAALEKEAMRNLNAAEYGVPLEPGWESIEGDGEPAWDPDAEDIDDIRAVEPAKGSTADDPDDAGEFSADQDGSGETGVESDESSSQALSWFKRK
jgi:RNA polymerase subunit RPABC4/transcription elongation factor Spt4